MSSKLPSYCTLSADTISKKMFDIVDEVNVVFQMPTPYVRLLLIACKWDKGETAGKVSCQWSCVLRCMTVLCRYYAGDQQALFNEAHVVPPQRQLSQPDSRLHVRVSLSPSLFPSSGLLYLLSLSPPDPVNCCVWRCCSAGSRVHL